MIVWRFKVRRDPKRVARVEGTWWKAYSVRKPLKDLHRQIEKEDVSIGFLENVEKLVDCGESDGGLQVIRIKLTIPKDKVDAYVLYLGLSEAGIGLIEPIGADNNG